MSNLWPGVDQQNLHTTFAHTNIDNYATYINIYIKLYRILELTTCV